MEDALILPGFCSVNGKRQYSTKREARERLRIVRYNRRRDGWPPHKIEKSFYHCSHCKRWHLTKHRKTPYQWQHEEEEEEWTT